MSLEVVLAGGGELDGNQLEAISLSMSGHRMEGSVEISYPRLSKRVMMGPIRPRCRESQNWSSRKMKQEISCEAYLDTIGLDGNEAIERVRLPRRKIPSRRWRGKMAGCISRLLGGSHGDWFWRGWRKRVMRCLNGWKMLRRLTTLLDLRRRRRRKKKVKGGEK